MGNNRSAISHVDSREVSLLVITVNGRDYAYDRGTVGQEVYFWKVSGGYTYGPKMIANGREPMHSDRYKIWNRAR